MAGQITLVIPAVTAVGELRSECKSFNEHQEESWIVSSCHPSASPGPFQRGCALSLRIPQLVLIAGLL